MWILEKLRAAQPPGVVCRRGTNLLYEDSRDLAMLVAVQASWSRSGNRPRTGKIPSGTGLPQQALAVYALKTSGSS